jgi:hypothetical protein
VFFKQLAAFGAKVCFLSTLNPVTPPIWTLTLSVFHPRDVRNKETFGMSGLLGLVKDIRQLPPQHSPHRSSHAPASWVAGLASLAFGVGGDFVFVSAGDCLAVGAGC